MPRIVPCAPAGERGVSRDEPDLPLRGPIIERESRFQVERSLNVEVNFVWTWREGTGRTNCAEEGRVE